MVNEFRKKLKEKAKNYFKSHETWNTPHFSFRDHDICMDIFGNENLVNKNILYTTVKYISTKAEDGIADRMGRLGEDYYIAKDYMKFQRTLPLLIKVRSWGWKEPDFEDLDDDQQKRFDHHKRSMDFSKRRSKRIQKMKEIQIGYDKK